MPPSNELGQLNTAEWDCLQDLADQFEEAWLQADSVDLGAFLPPAEAPFRGVALHELIKTDLEIRWRRGQLIGLEQYLDKFPELGTADALPPQLIYEEYHVRHLCGDRPHLATYQMRFPRQFGELQDLVEKHVAEGLAPRPAVATMKAPGNVVPVPPAWMVGSILPPGAGYLLQKRLGSGSFGEVWSALAPGGVEVALKFISRPVDSTMAQRELEALELIKRLRHPLLVQTQAFWSLEDRLIIVMELADQNLRERARECRKQGLPGIPVLEVMGYLHEAAEALDFLHGHHVHHRDVKPDNILLFKRHAKLADFGLARVLESRGLMTATGCGTPPYMPPEAWMKQVSIHGDQYSLACSYCELRLNRLLFPRRNPQQFMLDHLQKTPDLNPLPPAEQQVLHKALAKKPDDRYPSCLDFVRSLRQAVGSERLSGNDAAADTSGTQETRATDPGPSPASSVGSLSRQSEVGPLTSQVTPGSEGANAPADAEASTEVVAAPPAVRTAPPRRWPWIAALLLAGGLLSAGLIGVHWRREHVPVGELRRLEGHENSVLGLALSPDGRRLLSAGQDHTIRLWDIATGMELRAFRGHTDSIHAVAFSADGRRALSGGVDQVVRLWDIEAGKEMLQLAGHKLDVYSVAISPDSRWGLSGGQDATLRLWDLMEGKETRQFRGHSGMVNSVAFSPDGRFALSGSADKTIRLWDVTTAKEERRFRGHTSSVLSVAFSADGRRILSGSGGEVVGDRLTGGKDNTVRLWDTETGEELLRLPGHRGWVRSVAFSPDSRRALSCGSVCIENGQALEGEDHTVRLWDLESGLELACFDGHTEWVWCVAYAPDGRRAFSGSYDKTIRIWGLPE